RAAQLRHRAIVASRHAGVGQALQPKRYSGDAKAAHPLRLLLGAVEALDLAPPRSTPAELDQPLDRGGLTLEHRLDRAVVAVRHPARDPGLLGGTANGVAKEHALHPPAGDDPASRDVATRRLRRRRRR